MEYAERVNAAAGLAAAGVPVAEAARVLAGRFGCSQRQARRYLEVASRSGAVVVPEPASIGLLMTGMLLLARRPRRAAVPAICRAS